jgi:hypothetical protein
MPMIKGDSKLVLGHCQCGAINAVEHINFATLARPQYVL